MLNDSETTIVDSTTNAAEALTEAANNTLDEQVITEVNELLGLEVDALIELVEAK